MENLVLDAELLGRLISVKQPVQLCTPDGRVLGRYTPVGTADLADHGRPFISEEELLERESRKEGRTWAEILSDPGEARMNYTVLWDSAVEQVLADLWINASDRPAAKAAADRIDQLLKKDPEQQGESRSDGRRVLLVTPLGVLFRVLEQDRIVRVIQVWHFG